MLRQVADFLQFMIAIASLDAKKAFDRVHHVKLFNVLSDRNIPLFIIKVIVNWYSKMFASVRWNGVFFQYVAYKKWCTAR